VQIIERRGKRKDKVGARQGILGVASTHCVPGECGRVAKVLETSLAIPTVAVGAADPADAYARVSREILRGSIHHNADNLMARDKSFTMRP
jgi:hypothetical protein